MDKFQALQSFWSGFGVPAFDENTVPGGEEKPNFPYITYDAAAANLGAPVALSASLWDYGTSWERLSTLLVAIQSVIGRGGQMVPISGGALWIKQGSPFAQRMSDPNDMIRRIFINIEAEYITAD